MNKIKIVKKSGISQLVIKGEKGQQIIEREMYAINNNEVQGMLHFEADKRGGKFTLFYNITGFISLRDLLKTPLKRDIYAKILEGILSNLKEMQKAYFKQEYLLLNLDWTMVNPATQKIYFIYVPIQDFNRNDSLRNFLLSIIQCCTFSQDEDTGYVKEYIKILNNGINFSVFELEEYIKKLTGQVVDESKKSKCPNCKSAIQKGISYCMYCGFKIPADMKGIGEDGIYDPLSDKAGNKGENLTNKKQGDTQEMSAETVVLATEACDTSVLGENEVSAVSYPYLIRERNDEKIIVNKPSFRIGKEKKYSDYFVSDNGAISRSHADIVRRENRYYIVDLNSTNKTYVDGRLIRAEKEVEIYNGTKLRLANEEFVFYME